MSNQFLKVMEYKDFIKAGNKVAFIPSYESFYGWSLDVDPQVVTIGEYPVYFTDGTPDPTPEEFLPCCCVEIEENIHGEAQIELAELFGIELWEKEVYAIWGVSRCRVVGKVDYDYGDCYILEHDSEWRIVDKECFEFERNISDLSFDELCELRKEISLGSMYLTDYENSFGIDVDTLSSYSEGYEESLYEEYGEDWENHDTPEEFANYCAA